MTFLPVVERELRVAARRRSAFWVRLAAALVAVLVGASSLWLTEEWGAAQSAGTTLFRHLTGMAFLLCLLAGPVFTADVLSEEKREGTLGLLFLTDLRGYHVVLGKLVAASVHGVFSLLAILPVLAICMLMGGVSLMGFISVALALFMALAFSLATGLVVSAMTEQARSAFALTAFALFLSAGVCPWLLSALSSTLATQHPLMALLRANPTTGMSLANTAIATPLPAPLIANSQFGLLALIVGEIALAGWLASWTWQDRAQASRFVGWTRRVATALTTRAPDSGSARRRLLGINPILWLYTRHHFKTQVLWAFVGLALTGWLLWRVQSGAWADNWGSVVIIAILVQAPLKWLLASEATQRWAHDRQSGALELLLTTPLTLHEILTGHALAFRRAFVPPAVAILAVESAVLILGIGVSQQDREMGAMAIAGMLGFAADLWALGWVGLWLGLIRPRANRAFLGTIVRILILPWVYFLACVFVVGVPNWMVVPVVWLTVSLGVSLGLGWHARRCLASRLREIATVQFGGSDPKPA